MPTGGNPIRNLPLPGLFVTVAVLWTGVQVLFHLGDLTTSRMVFEALGGLVFAAIATAVVAASRRRLGSAGQVAGFTRALRTGAVPPDADRDRWQHELDRVDRILLPKTIGAIALSLLPIALGVWGLTAADTRGVAILLILLFVALDVAALVTLPRQRRRAAQLRSTLTVPPRGEQGV